ncbi:MFS transporter [Chromobacterium sp. ATCC 53434]|uniref:MFS transporter n=1 Tax=Chromobacterium sp. (strain ATCC 53434 / SC 14030) TaxID=2059672 RepID=UPI000C789065|nr:MFS transporter [Chromobacterium sp. ATCC 53434]AUH50079.1 MFS transporter [Chromobacterium sp. ATCC 53434]
MNRTQAGRHDGRGSTLAAVCLAALALPWSFVGGAVATPAIGRALDGSPQALGWVTSAFMLSFGSCLMAAGALADQFGRKRLFGIGIGLFASSSLAISLAPGLWWLNGLRALQGLAAAAAMAGGSAALAQEYEGAGRARAFSLLGTTFGLGLAFGPLLSGCLIQWLSWRAIFACGAAIGAAALLLALPRMRESRDPDAAGLDWPGAASFTAMLALFTTALLQGPQLGWRSLPVLALLAGSLVLLLAFIRIERSVARPMLDLSLFRYPAFVGVQCLPLATSYCYVALLVLLPLRFIGIEGQGEAEAGLWMLALSAPMLAMPSLAVWLTRWRSAGFISAVGLLIAAIGLACLSQAPAGSPFMLLALLLIGGGSGLPWGLMDGLSVSVVPRERAGMASGIFSTTRVAGEGMALAVVGALMAGFAGRALADAGLSAPPAAAQRLASGNLAQAHALLPTADVGKLAQAYDWAFQQLLYLLIALTLLSALMVSVLLRRGSGKARLA